MIPCIILESSTLSQSVGKLSSTKPGLSAKKVGACCEEPCLLFLCEGGMIGNFKKGTIREGFPGGSVVRICLPMWETWVLSLIQEDPMYLGEAEPGSHNC